MSNFLNSVQDYLWLVFILAIFIIFAVPQFIDLGKSIYLFYRVISSPKKDAIMEMIRKLLTLPDHLAFHKISRIIFTDTSHDNFDDLVRRFTTIVDKPVGINPVKTGKVNTPYYVDFVAACCDAIVLKRLAIRLACFINDTLEKRDYSFDYVISMSKSNVLIGLEVSKLLERPLVVIGPTSGTDLPRFPVKRTRGPLKFILVDGISSTGEEVLNIARSVKNAGHDMQFVFVTIDRCFQAKERLRNDKTFEHPIELFSICEYDDRKISTILNEPNSMIPHS